MKRPETAVFTVIFPSNLKFFPEFLTSLLRQTHRHFDLLLLVDGVPDIEKYMEGFRDELSVHTEFHSGSIGKVREFGLDWIREKNYRKIVFADSDDVMSSDRVAVCEAGLERFPVVVNDVVPFEIIPDLSSPGYWEERLGNREEFDAHRIQFYNFAGLGNSAIRTDLLSAMRIPSELIAVDWYLYYHWLQSRSGTFLHAGKVYYRQHDRNSAGLREVTLEKLERVINTKIMHFQALCGSFPELSAELARHLRLKQRLANDDAFGNSAIHRLNEKQINYFWWEETQYIQ